MYREVSDAPAERATVLICDDDRSLRELVRAALADGDYAFLEAVDGEQALELARSSRPDLMILDLAMPRRSGLEVLADVRRDRRLASTPVIVLTAHAQTADAERVAVAGADRYLAKPFSVRELARAAEDLIRARASCRSARSASPAARCDRPHG